MSEPSRLPSKTRDRQGEPKGPTPNWRGHAAMGYNQVPPCPEFPSACAPKPSNTACFRTKERPSPATSTLAIRKLSATLARPAPVAVIGFTNSSAASAAIATAPTAITFTAANAPSARAASPAPPCSVSGLPCSAGRSLCSPAALLRRLSLTLLPRRSRTCLLRSSFAFRGIQIRQERGQNSHRRQERANVVHKADARRIRQFPPIQTPAQRMSPISFPLLSAPTPAQKPESWKTPTPESIQSPRSKSPSKTNSHTDRKSVV